jgi:hypothetical protein
MKKAVLIFFAAFTIAGCKPEYATMVVDPGSTDMSNLVAIGDNFLSGYQDGAFTHEGQMRSVALLLEGHLNRFISAEPEYAPYLPTGISIGWSSKSWESWYVTASKLGDRTDCEGVISLGPVKEFISVSNAQNILGGNFSSTRNLTIPFMKTSDMFDPALGSNPFSDNHNPFYFPVAPNPGVSTVSNELRNGPPVSFFTAWLGMENIYSFARNGGVGASMISASTFADHLDSIFAPLVASGAKGVIANIPDFRSFPYYTLIPWDAAELTQSKADSLNDIYTVSGLTHIQFHEGANGFVINDPAYPFGVRQLHGGEYLTLGLPLDSVKCNYMGILFSTIPDRYVLDSSEVAAIEQMIGAYNTVIEQKAAQYGLALVDMHSFFNRLQGDGIFVNGVQINAAFVSGGFFSLDGYHPHQKGYAMITNEFIKAINLKFGATFEPLNCLDCDGVKFP